MHYLNTPTFDQLRTKEQLGYVVISGPRLSRDIIGSYFLIQSPIKDCEYVRKRLDIFLAKTRTKVQQMTDDEFETNINAVKTILSEKEKNLSEDFERVFGNELSIHAY